MPHRPRPVHEQLRDPPESGTPGARRGLWIRDGLFIAAWALLVIAADVADNPFAWLATALLLVRTFLKPAKTLWQRRA